MIRFKEDIRYKRVKERKQPDEGEQNILIADMIEPTGRQTSENYKGQLRRMAIYRPYDMSGEEEELALNSTQLFWILPPNAKSCHNHDLCP